MAHWSIYAGIGAGVVVTGYLAVVLLSSSPAQSSVGGGALAVQARSSPSATEGEVRARPEDVVLVSADVRGARLYDDQVDLGEVPVNVVRPQPGSKRALVIRTKGYVTEMLTLHATTPARLDYRLTPITPDMFLPPSASVSTSTPPPATAPPPPRRGGGSAVLGAAPSNKPTLAPVVPTAFSEDRGSPEAPWVKKM